MYKKALFLLVSCISLYTYSQKNTFQKVYGDPTKTADYAMEMIATSSGNYVVTGLTNFSPGSKALLMMIDCQGNIVWNKKLKENSGNSGYGYSVVETYDGNFVFTGASETYANGYKDAFLLKISQTGALIWYKAYGTPQEEEALDIIQTADSGFAAAGYSRVFNNGNIKDFLLFKTDKNGNLMWSKSFPMAGTDENAHALIERQNGDLIAVGYADNKAGVFDMMMVKADKNGNILSSRVYQVPGSKSSGRDIINTEDGGYIVVGYAWDALNQDYYAIKFDSNDNIQWAKSYDYTGDVTHNEEFNVVSQTNDKGFIMAGKNFYDLIDGYDATLFKVDSLGNPEWARVYGGINVDRFESVLQTPDSGYYLSGYFNNNQFDIYLVKTDKDGYSGCNELPFTPRSTNVNPTMADFGTSIDYGTQKDTTVTLQINNLPNDTLCIPSYTTSVSQDTSICVGESVVLTANSTSDFYLWSTSSTAQSITVSPTTTTSYSLSVYYNYCIAPFDTVVTVTVNSIPTLSLTASETNVCGGVSVTLTANSNASSYTWSNGETTQTITVAPTATSTYTATAFNGGCSIDSAITINVQPAPMASIAGDSLLCLGDSTLLTATGGSSFLWSTGETASFIKEFPSSNTVYSLTVSNGFCSDTTSSLVTVNSIPTLSISASDTVVCEGDPVTLTANTNAGAYVWSNSASTQTINIFPTSSSSYTVTALNGGCDTNSAITISLLPKPSASISGDAQLCYGDSTELFGTGGPPFQWSNGETGSSILVFPAISTVYSLTVTNGDCIDIADTLVTVSPENADAGKDRTIVVGQTVSLQASGGISYQWTPSKGLSCDNCSNPYASPDSTTTYYVLVTDANGCTAIDSVTIFVTKGCTEIYLPNAFSPNNDRQNDELKIYGSECIKTMLFTIYNRWGEKVFETTDANEAWNGIYRGKALDTGVFIYTLNVITFEDKEIILHGNFTLVK